MSGPARFEICSAPEHLAARAAEWVADRIASSTDLFRMALSGGNTPRLLYERLASADFRHRIEWRRLDLFWGDERFVPHTDERSNYRMVRETLLARAPVLIDHVHPIVTDGEPEEAARRYEAVLHAIYGAECLSPSPPLFDLVLLGLGADGHTASLFPGSRALDEHDRWVAAVYGREVPRITLTYPAIACSRAIVFLVTGADKAEAVARVHQGDAAWPAARIQSEGEVMWFLDKEAAGALPPGVR